MKQFLEFLKIFLEKHFFPAVSALALFLIVMIFIPSDWFVVTKLGIHWFRLLLFCLALLIVEGAIKIYQYIIKKINEAKEKQAQIKQQELRAKQQREYDEIQLQKNIEAVWTFVDSLSLSDKKYIEKFLKTGNAPIQIKDEFNLDRKLFASKAVHKTLAKEAVEDMYDFEPAEYKYKLVDEVYQLLKLSKEMHGKISHFD